MNPDGAIGNNALSDIGGVTSGSNFDAIFEELIEAQTPTPPGEEILDISTCPTINPVAATSTAITGTSGEASGTTIDVYVYQSNGTTLIGSGTTSTSGTTWTINVSSLSPPVTLAEGQKVKATATASGKGTSYDNCDIETVAASACIVQTAIPTSTEVVKISGSKGFDIIFTASRPIGTKVYLYTSNYSLRTVSDLKNSVTNPFTTTTSPQTFSFECQTGNCFGTDVYYFRFEEPGQCISEYYTSCDYATGTSAAPTISTSTITTTTTSISGNGTATNSVISIFSDGNQIATTTAAATLPFGWTATIPAQTLCKVITAKQVVSGQCVSASSAGVTVTRQAIAPVINSTGCYVTPPTTISGFSIEIGATVTLYLTSPSAATLGTAIVASDGTWMITPSPALAAGNIINAAVTSGTCLTSSANSASVTITTQTNISNYTIGITTPTEGETAVSGTISGGSYPVTLNIYVDEALVGSGTTVSAAGAWTVSGLNSFDLAVGSTVQVTLTETGCESDLSSTSTTVQCVVPSNKTIFASVTTYCYNEYGTITVQNSESSIVYTPVGDDGFTIMGYGALGTGSNLNLTTYALSSDPTIIKVLASKFPFGSCDALMSGSEISFTVNPLSNVPSASSSQTFCGSGTTTLTDLKITIPAGCTINWYNVPSGGSSIPSSTTVGDGSTYYAESENSTTGCVSSSRVMITTNAGTPTAPTASTPQTFCDVSPTIADLVASLSGPGTISWHDAASGGALFSSGDALTDGTTYYAQTNQNSCTSFRTAVLVAINSVTGGTVGSDQGVSSGGDPAAFTESVASTGAGILTYQWQSSTDNISYSNIIGASSTTYDPPSGIVSTTYFKRVTTSTLNSVACTAESNVITVTVSAPPNINTHPLDKTICDGDPTTFTVAADGATSYQWQMDTGAGFNNISGGVYTNETTATLSISNVSGLNGYLYRVNVTNAYGTVSSNSAVLSVNSVSGGSIATAQTICYDGDPAAFTESLASSGTGTLTYQWQSKTNGSYSGISGATSTTYDPPSGLTTTTTYRRVTTSTLNSVGCTANSNEIIVTVTTTSAPTGSATQTFCAGTTVASLVATGTTIQWYSAASGVSPLATSTTLADGTYYASQTANGCESPTRLAVTVVVNELVGGTITTAQTICSGGDPAAFTSTVAGSGDGVITYQWQSKTTEGYSNISGATSATYDAPSGITQNTTYQRVTTSTLNSVACTATSNEIIVTVNNATGGTVGSNQAIASGGDPAAFTEVSSSTGSGTLTYQWQSSTDNVSFSNIGGATATTYDPPSGLAVTTYYKRITSSTLNSVACTAASNVITVSIIDPNACNFNFADNFGTQAFSNNNGDTNFSNNWTETDDGNAATGLVRINDLTYCPGALGIGDIPDGTPSVKPISASIVRTANLTGIPSVTVTFGYLKTGSNSKDSYTLSLLVNGISKGTPITVAGVAAVSGTFSVTLTNTTDYPNGATPFALSLSGTEATSYLRIANFNIAFNLDLTASSINSSTNVSCYGGTDGAITLTAPSGGTGTYQYSINGGSSWQSGTSFTGLTAGSYNVRVRDANYPGCEHIINANYSITQPADLNITLGASPTVCQGVTSANLTYSATTGSPDLYTINFDGTAESQGFVDVTDASLVASPIVITVSGTATGGNYNATLSIKNSGTGCTKGGYAITIGVNAATGGTIATAQNICSGGDPAAFTEGTASTGTGTLSYRWQSKTTGSYADISGATSATYDPPGGLAETTYYQRVTTSTFNSVACTVNSNEITVTVTDSPSSTLAVADAISCNPATGNVTITVTSPEIGRDYELRTTGGASLSPTVTGTGAGIFLSLTILQANVPGTTTSYAVYAIGTGGCNNVELTDHPTLTVTNLPNASLAVSDASTCNPATGDVVITITNAESGIDYELQTTAGASLSPAVTGTGTGGNLNLTILQANAPTSATTYKVVATGTGGCSDVDLTDQPTVTVYNTPSINNPGNQSSCGDYTLPAITGTNLSGNEAYYTATNGGGTQYNATDVITTNTTLYIYDNNNGCDDEVSFDITITRFNLVVSPSGTADCPALLSTTTPPFEPNNSSYNPGATEVTFRVQPDPTYSYNIGWSFDFTLNGVVVLTAGSSTVTILTLEGDDITAPSRTGTLISGNVVAGSNTFVDLIFQIENSPGSAQTINFSISNADDGGSCAETQIISDNNGITFSCSSFELKFKSGNLKSAFFTNPATLYP